MADGIYNNVRRPAPDNTTRSLAVKTDSTNPSGLMSTESANVVSGKPKTKVAGSDQLRLSNVSQRLAAEPGFDRVKVESIKKAIQEGNYPIDPHRIAENFHSIEQMISQ
jgi:negative regulator of flagellin synthesis FlgM